MEIGQYTLNGQHLWGIGITCTRCGRVDGAMADTIQAAKHMLLTNWVILPGECICWLCRNKLLLIPEVD